MTSKMRIKMGPLEIEYEGDEQFLKDELPDILERVAELYKSSNIQLNNDNEDDIENNNKDGVQLTTSNIAVKLGSKSGPDIALSACANLGIVKGKSTFTRQEILDEMKTVTSTYKENMNKNLTRIIAKLIENDKLNEPQTGHFSLTEHQKNELRSKLAGK